MQGHRSALSVWSDPSCPHGGYRITSGCQPGVHLLSISLVTAVPCSCLVTLAKPFWACQPLLLSSSRSGLIIYFICGGQAEGWARRKVKGRILGASMGGWALLLCSCWMEVQGPGATECPCPFPGSIPAFSPEHPCSFFLLLGVSLLLPQDHPILFSSRASMFFPSSPGSVPVPSPGPSQPFLPQSIPACSLAASQSFSSHNLPALLLAASQPFPLGASRLLPLFTPRTSLTHCFSSSCSTFCACWEHLPCTCAPSPRAKHQRGKRYWFVFALTQPLSQNCWGRQRVFGCCECHKLCLELDPAMLGWGDCCGARAEGVWL